MNVYERMESIGAEERIKEFRKNMYTLARLIDYFQLEKRPHRFDLLRADDPKEWHTWMYDVGWGRVLDCYGVDWEDEFFDIPKEKEEGEA